MKALRLLKSARRFVVGAVLVFAVESGTDAKDPDNAAAIHLTATLADPVNMDLKWNAVPDASAYIVEFAFSEKEEFLPLDIVPATVTSFRHPDLIPETRFVYRIRPIFGKTSNVFSLATGDAPEEESGVTRIPDEAPATGPGTKSLRNNATADEAAPTDLTGTLAAPRVADLKWREHACDEDGYLLELKAEPNQDYHVVALLDPNLEFYEMSILPAKTTCYFRIVAFYFGTASNLDSKTTGPEPTVAMGPK